MRDIVIVILILILLFLSMRNAYSACLTYWWFSIFRPQDWVYTDITAYQLPLLATVIFFIGSVLRGYFPKVNDKLAAFMIAFYAVGILSSLLYGCSSDFQSINPLEYVGLLLIAIFLTVDIVKTKKQLFGLVCVITLSLAFYSGKSGIVAMLGGGLVNYGAENLGGMFTGSNAYAMGTAILIFFMIFIFKESNSFNEFKIIPTFFTKRKMFIKGVMALIILGSIFNVISLFSRGAALAMLCGFFVLYLLSNHKLKGFLIVAPIALILVATVPIPDGYKERLASAFADKEELDDSSVSRTYFWSIAGKIVDDYPIGVGSNCFKQYYNFYATKSQLERFGYGRDVHSSHVNAFVDGGYLGISVWIILFLVSLTRLMSLRRLLNKRLSDSSNYYFYYHLCEAAIASQIVYILGGAFYTLTYSDLIWWIWGLTIILTRLVKQELDSQANIELVDGKK